MWVIFKKFDYDNTGAISIENLTKVVKQLGKGYSNEEIHDMFKEVDAQEKGIIKFEEFKSIMMPDCGMTLTNI